MNLRRSRLLAAALAVLLPGCFEDDGIPHYEGTYEITRHTINPDGCAEEGPHLSSVSPYFELVETPWSIPTLDWHDCESPEKCDSFVALHRSFEYVDGEWIIERPDVWGGGVGCGLKLIEGTVVESDTGLTIEYRKLEGAVTVQDPDDCVPDLVRVHRDTMVCAQLEVIEAVPI